MKQKIATEMIEIDRLNEEIAEYEELRSITTLGNSRIIRYSRSCKTITINITVFSEAQWSLLSFTHLPKDGRYLIVGAINTFKSA